MRTRPNEIDTYREAAISLFGGGILGRPASAAAGARDVRHAPEAARAGILPAVNGEAPEQAQALSASMEVA